MNPPHRRLAWAAACVVALAAAGCKTSPCSPPCGLAEAPAAPPPAPRYAAPAPRPSVVMPPPTPAPDPAEAARIAAMKAELEARNREVARLEEESRRLEQERLAREAAAREAASVMARAEESARAMAEELKGAPGLQVFVEGPRVVAILTDSFASGSDQLKTDPNVRAALKAIAAAAGRQPGARVTVTGHTDGQPIRVSKWPDNAALSKARAETVANLLAAEGMTRDRMAVNGVGEREPLVAPEKTAADRAKNRRVEVEFDFGPATGA